MRMPEVLCGGRLVVSKIDGIDDEIKVTGFGPDHAVYFKRGAHESYDEFVRRVTKYCEDKYFGE